MVDLTQFWVFNKEYVLPRYLTSRSLLQLKTLNKDLNLKINKIFLDALPSNRNQLKLIKVEIVQGIQTYWDILKSHFAESISNTNFGREMLEKNLGLGSIWVKNPKLHFQAFMSKIKNGWMIR